MQNNSEENYLSWFKKADEDALSAEAVLKEGAPSTGCFLAQQTAEKYLKGLLVFHKVGFPKVHDLLELETLIKDVEPGIKEYEKELDLLNRFYTETRYPGDYPEFTLKECRNAFEAALRIKTFVLSAIAKENKKK